jgi:malate dehydrogenase
MLQVAIVGAGELGGMLAHGLARRSAVSGLRLIDESGQVAEGKALDITQAAPIEGWAGQVSGSGHLAAAAGAQIVVVAQPFDGPPWQGDAGMALLKRLGELTPRSLVVCADASHRELVERAVRELAFVRTRLVGSAPEAIAAAARAMVALAIDGSPRDVGLSVLGVPPHHPIIPWQDATAAGFALTRLLDRPAQRRVEARVAALWPPGPSALAAAAVEVVLAALGRSRRLVSCFVAADDAAGRRSRAAAWPVRLGGKGVEMVLEPELSPYERVRLDTAIML